MTSLEDWSLSTLSSQIFRQQTQLQLRPGNSKFLFRWQAQLEGDRAATAVCELVVCLVADEGDSYNCYLGTRVLGGRPSWKMGYNCNLGTRGFLWWLGWPSSTAM